VSSGATGADQAGGTADPGGGTADPAGSAAVQRAVAHLRGADPVLGALIDQVGGLARLGDRRRGRPDDHHATLVRSIVGQQLSTRAAAAIWTRLIDRFDGRAPTAEQVLACDPEELRATAGLSRAKVSYLRSLAEHVLDGRLQLEHLSELPDAEVIAELTAVRGLGIWSAHMFLIFHLGRPDVLASGDLGVRRAVEGRYGLPTLPTPREVESIAEPWRPHRTLACLFLWRSLDAAPV
jgi:DNA-3-methyladenine glycosylase II